MLRARRPVVVIPTGDKSHVRGHFRGLGSRQRGAFLTGSPAADPEAPLDDRVRRYDKEMESTNLETRAASPNPLGEADFREVMAKNRKATRKTKTPRAEGVDRKAGKRAGARAVREREPGVVPPGFTLRAVCRGHTKPIRLIDWSIDGKHKVQRRKAGPTGPSVVDGYPDRCRLGHVTSRFDSQHPRRVPHDGSRCTIGQSVDVSSRGGRRLPMAVVQRRRML